jgi:hypothetical protein
MRRLDRGRGIMGLYTNYRGKGLNHLEVYYQPGERDLAIRLVETLGCVVSDSGEPSVTGATYLCVHPDSADRDLENNVIYLAELPPVQQEINRVFNKRLETDQELAASVQTYCRNAIENPHSLPHFGLRFPSFESVEPVLDRIERNVDPALKGRFSIRVIRPEDPGSMYKELLQVFVHTDILSGGLSCFGQAIELQAHRAVQ